MTSTDSEWSRAEEIASTRVGRPHVVLLGAGASKQAFPGGDANGRPLPLMSELVHTVGLESAIERAGFETPIENFEAFYSALCRTHEHDGLRLILESKINDYFGRLQLPDYPTVYDYLVLSLRPKDIIATFNWDPLLYNACYRGSVPNLVEIENGVTSK